VSCLRPLLAGFCVLVLAACSPDKPTVPPAAPNTGGEIVGTSAEINNSVDLRSAAEPDWRAAQLQGPVRYADAIRTQSDSRLVVAFVDKALLTVGPNAQITLDRFLIDTRPGVAGATVSVTKGAFRFASGKSGSSPDPVRFDTPIATIGIRGTILEGVVGPDALAVVANGPMMEILASDPTTATLIVLREGVVEVEIGQTIVVLDIPGQSMVLAGARWSQPFMLSTDAGVRLDGLLAPPSGRPKPPAGKARPRPEPEPEAPPQTELTPPDIETPPPSGRPDLRRPDLTRPDLRRPELRQPGGGPAVETPTAAVRAPPRLRPDDRRMAPADRRPVPADLPSRPERAPAAPTAPRETPLAAEAPAPDRPPPR
jgi:hypothetical protein